LLQIAIAALMSLAAYTANSTINRLEQQIKELDARIDAMLSQHADMNRTIDRLNLERSQNLWKPTAPPINQPRSKTP
jgi:prefoldin subunit 5